MTRQERYKHALKWVNERRKEGGLRATSKLSKGYKGHAFTCPIAASLRKVGVTAAWPTDDGRVILSSGLYEDGHRRHMTWREPDVCRFMLDYDAGKYPELVIKPKPIKAGGVVIHGD